MADTSDSLTPNSRNDHSEMNGQLSSPEAKARFFDLMTEDSLACIFFKDLNLRYTFVNSTWARWQQVTDRTSVIGKCDHDFFPKETAGKFSDHEKRVIEKGEPSVGKIEKITLGDGNICDISITCIPLTDKKEGKVTGLCGICHEVSSLTQTEEKLTLERDMLHMLLNHSRDAIYFKDLDCRFLRVSKDHPALQYVSTPEEAIGKTDFDYFPAEHAKEAFDDEKEIIATGKPILGKLERETAEGAPERWVFTSKMPWFDKDGKIIGTFGISRDITQIKMYEQELHKTKEELEERVRDRTRDLETRVNQLDFLTSASYEMAQCTGIKDLSNVILRLFSQRLNHTVSSLCISEHGKFVCASAAGLLASENYAAPSEHAITQLHAQKLTRPAIIRDWSARLPHIAPWTEMGHLPLYIAIPLLADNRLIGILQLFAGDAMLERFEQEEKVLFTLATQAAVSLSNAIYYKELGEKAQLKGELEAARSIQQRLTPSFKPSIPRVNLKGLYSPAYEVGGDYLDYFRNDAGCWVVVIADVCGKGVPAALLMTLLRSAFRGEARYETSAKNLLCSVNDSMRVNLDDRSFVTAICLIINPDGTSMSYARAGHPRLIRIAATGSRRVESYDTDGIALGIIPDVDAFADTIEEIDIPLNEGDRFFIYTDGLTEAFNREKNPYTTKRLLTLLEGSIGSSPESILTTIINDIKSFTQGAPYHDDLTLIAMEVSHNGHT